MEVPAVGLVIRAEDARDHHAITEVVTRAFGSPNEARLVEALRASPSYVPEWSLVATRDRRVVGHVMVTYATLRVGSSEHRIASLSPLSVHPDHQRRGIGSALVRAVTPIVDSAHEPMIVLEGSPGTTPASGSSTRCRSASPSTCLTGHRLRLRRYSGSAVTTRPYTGTSCTRAPSMYWVTDALAPGPPKWGKADVPNNSEIGY